MSLRIAARTTRLAARPILARPVVGAMPSMRLYSTELDPKDKATAIIDALPGNTPLTKTGLLATGAAASVYAISNGMLVANSEALMLGCFLGVVFIMSKTVAPAYGSWAQGHVDTFKNVLTKARQGHVAAVKERIESVNQLKDVVETTKSLFALSKETAQLESTAFELKQKVDFASEAKAVLDSWVRYEGQVRQREQEELAANVIAKVNKQIAEPKFKQQVLEQAIADVEKVFAAKK
ncbi:ATP synthase subunit 4, mitochondrial [Trichomonascus vanleenenianus]|uniref:F1F0 ATP synthase subunit 4 n=1 Tax=Trichomonascus vanleenenianus TaxID=2268995 RepID=UPI003ECB4E2C